MKWAAQENLVPGSSFAQKVELLARIGYEGIELRGDGLPDRVDEVRRGLSASGLKATCICGGFTHGLLFSQREEREASLRQIEPLLQAAGELQAQGVIIVPIFGAPQVPDLSPWRTAAQIEEELLILQLERLARYAQSCGTQVILEPLNRYETHMINRLEQAVAVVKRVNHTHVTVLADVFHMAIEEADLAAAIRGHGRSLGYVHLADSNRQVPGLGHTDFRAVFAALHEVGYAGWMSLECGVPDGERSLQETLTFMKAKREAAIA
ncbi:MAG: sugar phosphate isomerase/epimerase [Firmicutes bacterium]|nr:sugar phosphate isomerase/epimerase [Bacillota bacterium]